MYAGKLSLHLKMHKDHSPEYIFRKYSASDIVDILHRRISEFLYLETEINFYLFLPKTVFICGILPRVNFSRMCVGMTVIKKNKYTENKRSN